MAEMFYIRGRIPWELFSYKLSCFFLRGIGLNLFDSSEANALQAGHAFVHFDILSNQDA